jgi:hypothetical protein
MHDTLPLQTELLAHVALSRNAVLAALAFSDEDSEHVVSHMEFSHSTYTLDYSTEYRYKVCKLQMSAPQDNY